MDNLYIVIPAYNEAENIDALINNWYPVVESHNTDGYSRLVVVNDGSKDNTYDLLLKNAKDRPLLVPLTKTNGGHGPTVLYAYRYAISQNADWIFQTDSDGQTDPAEFEQFWKLRNQYDAVIGSRPRRQDGWSRKMVEKTLLIILRLTFGVKIPDSNAPYRLMKKDLVKKYIDKMPEDFNLPNVMFTTYFAYFKENIKFIDITFKPRQGGVNSINVRKIFKIGWTAVGDFRKLKANINSFDSES